MNFVNIDLKKFFATVAIVGIPFISINMQRNTKDQPFFLVPFSFLTSSIQVAYSTFNSGVRGTTRLYFDLIDIKKNNRILVNENAVLRAQLGEMTELKLENQRLNDLLEFKKKSKMELLAAKVVGKDAVQDHDSVTLNRGSKHGVLKGAATITQGGVVGYVVKVDLLTSQVLLVTDRYIAIDAIVQRSRARGVLKGGQSQGLSSLSYLQRGDDVEVGDLVVTSGLDNIFPKGFPIGNVVNVERSEYGVSQGVEVQPTVPLGNLEEVYIVLDAKEESFSKNEEKVANQPPTNPTETEVKAKESGAER